MSNLGLEVALGEKGIELVRAKVGDRYVMAELQSRGWLYGGESSGHIICLDETTTGDGIVSALQVLAAMRQAGKSLYELRKGMSKYPQTMINVRIARRDQLAANAAIAAAIRDLESTLGQRGRVLLRPSGTEPVVRVMVEGEDATLVARLAGELADVVRRELG
jgi:phosphoglucosamine mutase